MQLSVKINDHTSNGGTRYKAWAYHRETVIKRLGWRLLHSGLDYATFMVPHGVVANADGERRCRLAKEKRLYWSDKNDFCRCLEVVLDEALGKLSKSQKKQAVERGEGPKRGRKRKLDLHLAQDGDEMRERPGSRKKNEGLSGLGSVSHLVGHDLAPVPPPPGICGGSAGPLGLATAWQMGRQMQHTQDSSLAHDDMGPE